MLNYPFKFFATLLQVDRKQIDCVNKVCVQTKNGEYSMQYLLSLSKIENVKNTKTSGTCYTQIQLTTLHCKE